MLTNAMKDELIKGLLNIFSDDIKAIILYGSVAKNESTSESDIDQLQLLCEMIWMI